MVIKPVILGHSRAESECWKLTFFQWYKVSLQKLCLMKLWALRSCGEISVSLGYSHLKTAGASMVKEKILILLLGSKERHNFLKG